MERDTTDTLEEPEDDVEDVDNLHQIQNRSPHLPSCCNILSDSSLLINDNTIYALAMMMM
jgi:hypothetical protein